MRPVLTCLLAGVVTTAGAMPQLSWHNRFSAGERAKLVEWIGSADRGVRAVVGPLPFRYRVEFHRSAGRGEPVPWAQTSKRRDRLVQFHVDPSYSLSQFERDWTAPHEIAHLLFPYVGEDDRWFSEGIASYLQYPLMAASGTIDRDAAVAKLRERFARAQELHRGSRTSIEALSRNPGGRGAMVRLYWGGATYFLIADRRLHAETGQRLTDVIREYINCCARLWSNGCDSLIRTFDRISGTDVFSRTRRDTVGAPGFPATDAALDWLAGQPMPTRGGAGTTATSVQ